ncbi:MAG: hypothetical protein GY859_33965 [Desulfobacterales bacterium]|nr:hypothetical protein [Desulfobacterales bacterium]
MRLFDDIIGEIKTLAARERFAAQTRRLEGRGTIPWPEAGRNNVILTRDVGVELGNPGVESMCFFTWTGTRSLVEDGAVTLIGPDIPEASDSSLPLGKVVLIGGEGFDADNAYDRFREMDLAPLDLSLDGYMVRAVSRQMREWSRISREALAGGFNFSILGGALIDQLKKNDYVDSVEVMFITSSEEDVREFGQVGQKARRYIDAMRKMAEEVSFDCSSCDYQDVCDEVDELKAMRDSMKESD